LEQLLDDTRLELRDRDEPGALAALEHGAGLLLPRDLDGSGGPPLTAAAGVSDRLPASALDERVADAPELSCVRVDAADLVCVWVERPELALEAVGLPSPVHQALRLGALLVGQLAVLVDRSVENLPCLLG
jgi:hypothetical protein